MLRVYARDECGARDLQSNLNELFPIYTCASVNCTIFLSVDLNLDQTHNLLE